MQEERLQSPLLKAINIVTKELKRVQIASVFFGFNTIFVHIIDKLSLLL